MVQEVDPDAARHLPCGHLAESRQAELGEVDLVSAIVEVDDGIVPMCGAEDEVVAGDGVADERVVAGTADEVVATSSTFKRVVALTPPTAYCRRSRRRPRSDGRFPLRRRAGPFPHRLRVGCRRHRR